MLFEGQFRVVTTSDTEMLFDLARSFQPSILLADAVPTRRLYRTLEALKGNVPELRIILLTVQNRGNVAWDEIMKRVVDAACEKESEPEELFESVLRLA